MSTPRVTRTPGICGGVACIDGTRIMVWLLVASSRHGMDDTAIHDAWPTLPPGSVDAAFDYCSANPAEIEQDIWVNDVAANHPAQVEVPDWLIVQGKLLGVADERLREVFEPVLEQERIDAAWRAYRESPQRIHREIIHSLRAA
ncbi:MAG: DUF433 domain-containing protein [Gemmataceae bacterium]|nr:DUF433 domain-containing protein [Gemmataceae bacterium]